MELGRYGMEPPLSDSSCTQIGSKLVGSSCRSFRRLGWLWTQSESVVPAGLSFRGHQSLASATTYNF